MAAKPKVMTDQKMIDIATHVLKTNQEIENLDTTMGGEKDDLKKFCQGVFFTDLGGILDKDGVPTQVDLTKEPDVYGNHEFTTPDGLLTVNFKTSNLEIDNVNDVPASQYLNGVFGTEYTKIFDEKDLNTVKEPDGLAVYNTAVSTPDKFRYMIRGNLTPDHEKTLAAMALLHPKIFQVIPKDMEVFSKENPNMTVTKKVFTPASGFIEKLAKMDKVILKNAQSFLIGFFKRTLNISVKCGNAAKK